MQSRFCLPVVSAAVVLDVQRQSWQLEGADGPPRWRDRRTRTLQRAPSAASQPARLWGNLVRPKQFVSAVRCDDLQSVSDAFVESQRHLLKPSKQNPIPVTVPPPVEGLSGHHLRHKIVTCVIGMPIRGQAHAARRLQRYLAFFHGASTDLFDVNDYLGPTGRDDLLESLRSFFGNAEAGREKHAILFTSNAILAAESLWSGHSKSNRRWLKNVLGSELGAHLYFVDIQVNETPEHRQGYMEGHWLTKQYGGLDRLHRQLKDHEKRFVTIQEDGTEDDLSYIKVMDYTKKVATNNMMQSFLGSRLSRFLGNLHPYRQTVYLVRTGECEYRSAGKIGGDSQLSRRGRIFSLRLAEFVDAKVCKQAEQFACVTLDAPEVGKLESHLTEVQEEQQPDGGHQTSALLVAKEGWEKVDGSGNLAAVQEGMVLTRVCVEGADSFQDAPATLAGLAKLVEGGQRMTFIFVDAVAAEAEDNVCARLWTSSLLRAKQTGERIRHPMLEMDGKAWMQMAPREYRNLNEQYAGEYEGLTLEDIAGRQAQEAELLDRDPLGYRYPRGESRLDVIARLEDSVQLMESYRQPVVIVTHLSVLRLLYTYIMGLPREQAETVNIPDHSVIRMEFDGTEAATVECFVLGPTRRFGEVPTPTTPM